MTLRYRRFAVPAVRAALLPLTLGGALVVAGCASDDPHRRAKTGAAVGAVAGAVAGHQMHDRNGRYFGAAVGALTGAAVGNYMDRQQRAIEEGLARELGSRQIRVTRIDEETLKLDVSSESTFDVNSATVRADFRGSLHRLASVIDDYESTAVHVHGHTDATGTESYNQKLSNDRADAVARHLMRGGVARDRVRETGFGETRPIADNATSAGRSRNRRVEIYLKSVVEGREADAFRAPA